MESSFTTRAKNASHIGTRHLSIAFPTELSLSANLLKPIREAHILLIGFPNERCVGKAPIDFMNR